jgi:hypothetical protein
VSFVWLASYPKSGNTWFRMLAANLLAEDQPIDINLTPERGGIASARGEFEAVTLLDSGLLTHDEADSLRPRVYAAVNAGPAEEDENDGAATRLLKVHDAYLPAPGGEPLLGGPGAGKGAIVVVRDPRDVAPSLANHRNSSVDDAIAFMADRGAAFASSRRAQALQLRQRLLDWSGHIASWLDQTDLPVHLVRYEDLGARPVEVFRAAMAFADRPVTQGDAEKAVDFASFGRLRAQETEYGFAEWRRPGDGRFFFRSGESGGWRRELTADQVRRIEAAHGPMMARLGYPLAAEPAGSGLRASGEVR